MRRQKILILALALILTFTGFPLSHAAPMPVISYYAFQPNGTPYHYYSFGDEIFYHVAYDSVSKCHGYHLGGLPRSIAADGWLRDTMPINGTYQHVNARYQTDTLNPASYPAENQDLLLMLTVAGQNRPAVFDSETGTFTLYMKPGASLKAPEINVTPTSLGYQRYPGGAHWCLTNDISEKEQLADLYIAMLFGDYESAEDNWEAFSDLFTATTENQADLSKETWLTVFGNAIGGYRWPELSQFKIVVSTDESPLAAQPLLLPRTAEFDQRLLYQSHLVFNFTDYTRKPLVFTLNGQTPPEKAVAHNEFMCVVSKDYLASLSVGDTVSLTVRFDDGTQDTASIRITDTTDMAYTPIFTDVTTASAAWEFIHPMVQQGIITESGGTFRPDENITQTEFYALLKNAGMQTDAFASPAADMVAADAQALLFEVLTTQQTERYAALNKQHLWLPNTYGDLDSDDFRFFGALWLNAGGSSDLNHSFTRAQAAEAMVRFVGLLDYADGLLAYQSPTVAPTSSAILLNGEAIVFDAYTIGGNNYFKLRDLAFALDGTEAQFSVDYNEQSRRISLFSGEGYRPVGGEMSGKGSAPQTANLSPQTLRIGDSYYGLEPYEIAGNNYFRLRDIAALLDFSVQWNGAQNTIRIETSRPYEPE